MTICKRIAFNTNFYTPWSQFEITKLILFQSSKYLRWVREHYYVYTGLAFCSDNLFWLECTKNSNLKRCLELCAGEGLSYTGQEGKQEASLWMTSLCSSSSSHLRAIPSYPEIHILLSTLSFFTYFKTYHPCGPALPLVISQMFIHFSTPT